MSSFSRITAYIKLTFWSSLLIGILLSGFSVITALSLTESSASVETSIPISIEQSSPHSVLSNRNPLQTAFSNSFTDANGDYSLNYPQGWSVVAEKYWVNDSLIKFDSLLILQAPDEETISVHLWKNVPDLALAELSEIYLQPILSQDVLETDFGRLHGRDAIFVTEVGNQISYTPTIVYAIFQCNNVVYRIQYTGSKGGSQLQVFKELLSSMHCTGNLETQPSYQITTIPEMSPILFVDTSQNINVDHCEGFWDPNENRYVCGECTWWANYSRPDIPNSYAIWPGNANNWDDLANQHPDFTVSPSPEPGAIAVWEANHDGAGSAGHVAYVTWVNANGSFHVTEMNWAQSTFPAPPNTRLVTDTPNINFIQAGVTFFENASFGGDWERVRGDVANLSNNFAWGASSIFIPSGWDTIFYRHTNYNPSSYRHRWGNTGLNSLESSFWDLAVDNYSDSSNMNDNVRSVRATYYACLADPTGLQQIPAVTTDDPVCGEPPPPPPVPNPTPTPVPGDNAPPSASGFSATPSGGIANLSTSGVQDNPGGSGVREVRFSAKFNNQWVGIGVDTTVPYSLAWDMCASGVPDGDVELGMEVWDNANNVWIWSQHYNNPHITKNHNCAPPPVQEGVFLYPNTGLGGIPCYITQDQPSIGNYCGSGWNDNAESVSVNGPYYFALFRDDWYGGGTPYTGNPTGDLPPEWRNQASSIRIRRNSPAAFTLFDLGDYNGQSWASDRTIFDMGHWAWNDRAESIQVASGYSLIVCEHSDFKGVCGRATGPAQWSDINALAQGLRNSVSSVRVCSGTCPEAGSPPTLNYPINNQTVDAGQAVVFSWGGSLNQFYVEVWGGGLGSTLRHGWTSNAQWNAGVLPESANPYHWQVKGWRGYGETGWATGSFYVTTPDTTPPSGVMTAPHSGGYQGGPTVTLAATASDSGSGVNRLEFYAWLDDRWEFLGTDSSAPYSFAWDISSVREGGVWVSADVIDNAGNHSGLIWEPDWSFFVIDKSPPSSAVIPLPATQPYPQFTVRWSGNDNFTPNDLIFYEVQYQLNCTGSWIDWFGPNNWEGATFTGEVGQSYCFRSRASDLVGNTETWPESADTRTRVIRFSNVYLPLVVNNAGVSIPTPTPTPTSTPTPTPTPTATPTPTPVANYDWTSLGSGSPSARAGMSFAYDDDQNKLIMFGGTCSGQACSDTWEYTVSGWQQISVNGPSAREGAHMTYDSTRQKVVLFGGHVWAGSHLSETWEFDGATWTQKSTSTNPSSRSAHAIAFDQNRNKVVMFGGWTNTQLGNDILGDTWEYDGTNWMQINSITSPSARSNMQMVYAPNLGGVVLFGGIGRDHVHYNDTWLYNEQGWTQLTPAQSPPARYGYQMTYDPNRNVIILFGGTHLTSGTYADTWIYDGNNWEQDITTNSPPPTWLAGFAYYPPRNGAFMFGGNSPNQNDLTRAMWLYSPEP